MPEMDIEMGDVAAELQMQADLHFAGQEPPILPVAPITPSAKGSEEEQHFVHAANDVLEHPEVPEDDQQPQPVAQVCSPKRDKANQLRAELATHSIEPYW